AADAAEKAAKTKRYRLFVCGGAYSEGSTVTLAGGMEVYGGFKDCPKSGDWKWDEMTRATLNGPPGMPVVKVSPGETKIRNVNITAPDAAEKGTSSIGMIAD